jgi:hypothetical protein
MKVIGLGLVGALSLVLAAPVSAGKGSGVGFHSGFHHGGFHRFGCCFGPAFVGGVVVASALGYPDYAFPYAAYPVYPDPVYVPGPACQPQTQPSVAPAVQRDVCYAGGCYHLQGDGGDCRPFLDLGAVRAGGGAGALLGLASPGGATARGRVGPLNHQAANKGGLTTAATGASPATSRGP